MGFWVQFPQNYYSHFDHHDINLYCQKFNFMQTCDTIFSSHGVLTHFAFNYLSPHLIDAKLRKKEKPRDKQQIVWCFHYKLRRSAKALDHHHHNLQATERHWQHYNSASNNGPHIVSQKLVARKVSWKNNVNIEDFLLKSTNYT